MVLLSNFILASLDDIVDFASNLLYLRLSIKSSSYLLVCFNEAFQLLLEAVVLVVQVCHVLVQGVDFGLKLHLVLAHLVRVLSDSVNLISKTIFILLQLLQYDV